MEPKVVFVVWVDDEEECGEVDSIWSDAMLAYIRASELRTRYLRDHKPGTDNSWAEQLWTQANNNFSVLEYKLNMADVP